MEKRGGRLTTPVSHPRGRVVLLIEPHPVHRRDASTGPLEAVRSLISRVENLAGVRNRSRDCPVRGSQWHLFFYSNANLVKLGEVILLSIPGNARAILYASQLNPLESSSQKPLHSLVVSARYIHYETVR